MTFKRHTEKGLADFDLEMPEVSSFPARIMIGSGSRKTDAELMDIVKTKFAVDADQVKAEDSFFFRAQISNQNLDSYHTKMAESSLRNYAADASEGVSFQNSHLNYSLGVGMVINGEYVEADEMPRVFADMYTVRGLKLNSELGTDDLIRGIQTGLIRDVSIGFKPGEGYKETCNICKRGIWTYECRHIPGMTYEVGDDPDADPSEEGSNREVLCFAWIENARLSEVSAVYDGATPDAMILTKARRENRAGRMDASIRSQLNKRFHIDVSEPRGTFGGSAFEKEERPNSENTGRSENEMTELEKALERAVKAESDLAAEKLTSANEKARADLAETKLETAEGRVADLDGQIRKAAEGIEGIEITDETKSDDLLRSIRSNFDAVAPKAAEVENLRNAKIEEAIQSGVRAFGDKFDADGKRATLAKLDLSEIEDQKAEWDQRGEASGKFKGGRRSADEAGDPPAGEGGEGGEGEGGEGGDGADAEGGDGEGGGDSESDRSSSLGRMAPGVRTSDFSSI